MHNDVTRRTVFATGGLGALAALSLGSSARAATPASDGDKANLKVVEGFLASWGAPDYDPEKSANQFLADDSSIRMVETMPFLKGPAAAAAAFKSYMTHGERFKVKIVSSYARGPIVVTERVDTQITPGKPDQDFKVVGVFFVKDGKIKEWTDYSVS